MPPVIVGAVTLGRIAYTAHTRKGDQEILPIAENAQTVADTDMLKIPSLVNNNRADSTTSSEADSMFSQRSSNASSTSSVASQASSTSKDKTLVTTDSEESEEYEIGPVISQSTHPVALFPQYLTEKHVRVSMVETPLPHRGSTFSIIDSTSDEPVEILKVRRGKASFSERRFIVDSRTDQDVMCVRQDVGKLPRSYRFDDVSENKILDLQGNFFNLTKGPKSHAHFTNALDGKPARLFMQGAFKRRHASIKNLDTDEILASVTSEAWNAKAWVGRRTYEIELSAGTDIVLVVGMIVALDARGSFIGPGQLA